MTAGATPVSLTIAIALFALAVLTSCVGNQSSGGSSSSSAVQSQLQSPLNSPSTPPTSSPSPLTLASPAITTTEVLGVAEKIFQGPHPAGCDWRDRLNCPVTDRLAARMEQLAQPSKVGPGPIALFCRCQNVPAPGAQFDPEVTPTGGVAHVTLGALKLDLIMIQETARLLVDDTQCTGRGPSTSIYAELVLCGA